ncbi:MAG: DUF547 domain-containing protein [Bacteroidota bacterium]
MRNPFIFFTASILFLMLSQWHVHARDASDPSLAATVAPEGPTVSHDIWNTLVQLYVSADGVVNYKGFKQSKGRLDVYLQQLSQHSPQASWSREEQMAYWINLYNAATVALIVEHYPLKSIMDIEKPWDKAFVKVGSKTYTLNQIEHEILRPQFKDPRIHFAVNCASQSCPELLNQAYSASKLNQQLESQTKKFVNNPKHNSIDKSEVSQLFNWYKEDFIKEGTVVDYLNSYAKTPFKKGKALSFREYDWNLNE